MVVAVSVYFGASYKSELDDIKSIEREASALNANRRMNFTDEGFINATLSFLEKHRAEFPETYERAKLMWKKNGCSDSAHKRSDSLQHAWDRIAVASAMEGILKGIAKISGGK